MPRITETSWPFAPNYSSFTRAAMRGVAGTDGRTGTAGAVGSWIQQSERKYPAVFFFSFFFFVLLFSPWRCA